MQSYGHRKMSVNCEFCGQRAYPLPGSLVDLQAFKIFIYLFSFSTIQSPLWQIHSFEKVLLVDWGTTCLWQC